MNHNFFCCFDLETGGTSIQYSPILQLSAAILDRNNLEIIDEFNSYVKPDDYTHIEDQALAVNHIERDKIGGFPDEKVVFSQFVDWTKKYNVHKNKSSFGAPIPCGLNILRFDLPIIDRYCQKYGPWDSKRNENKLFKPVFAIDIMQTLFYLLENDPDIDRFNISALMDYFGIDKSVQAGAHDALFDVKFSAAILQKLLKLERYLTTKNENGQKRLMMKGSLATWKP